MHCVERIGGWGRVGMIVALLSSGCSSPPAPQPMGELPRGSTGVPGGGAYPVGTADAGARLPIADVPSTRPALAAPLTMRTWLEVRRQAAERLVVAHPEGSYTTEPPLTLLAIPVLEVELNGDGSIRRIVVLREPRQALDTTQIAIEALHRAAPFGDVRRLPRPWKFVETFLFDEQRRFKPRSLD